MHQLKNSTFKSEVIYNDDNKESHLPKAAVLTLEDSLTLRYRYRQILPK
jgi:hypothetical protein